MGEVSVSRAAIARRSLLVCLLAAAIAAMGFAVPPTAAAVTVNPPPGSQAGPDPAVPGANSSVPPGSRAGKGVAAASDEYYPLPADCPQTGNAKAPFASYLAPGDLYRLCRDAMAMSATYESGTAIRWAFGRLGTPYSQGGSRDGAYFDCATFVGRSYRAAGAEVRAANGGRYDFYPYFLWTGSYTPVIRPITSIGGGYEGTNLRRISRAELQPGDIVIKFAGSDPLGSAGNAGHAQLYLGDDWVIESGGKQAYSNVDIGRMSFDPDTPNEWYFRYDSLYNPKWPSATQLPGGASYKMKVGAPGQTVIGTLTVVDPVADGHTRLYTCGTPMPGASTSQFVARRTTPIMATVKLDGEGSLCIYLSATAHLMWDQSWSGTALTAHPPARRVDTRLTAPLAAGAVLPIDTGAPGKTVMATISVINPRSGGHTRVFPCDADADGVIDGPPQASVNNFTAGQRTANFATVKADRQGRICVYSSSATDLLWDQVLETAAPAAHTPVRYYDSRLPAGSAIANNAGQRIDPNDGSKVVRIHTGIPGGAVIGNVTVTDPQTDGRTAVFACNDLAAAATTSASNFVSGQTLGNGAFWRADPNGDVCIRTTALAHLIWDQAVETTMLAAAPEAVGRKMDSRRVLMRPQRAS